MGLHLEQVLQDGREIPAVLHGDVRVHPGEHLLEKAVHVVGAERRLEGAHFVEDATEGPDVALGIVRLISPDLGRSVVGGPCLSVQETLFSNFRHIQVPQLDETISI